MGKAFLVTGTDTGVGKTFVACGLLRAFREMGVSAAPFKPVETGCPEYPMDGSLLKEAAGLDVDDSDIVPFLFSEPLAPAVAEELEGKKIDLEVLGRTLKRLRNSYEVVVVEGAGGLLVPVKGRVTYADLAVMWDLPVLVVARSKLGTINHTLLTIRVARAYGLKVLAVVLNGYEGTDAAERTNPRIIRELGDCEVFLVGRHDEPPVLKEIAGFLHENLAGS